MQLRRDGLLRVAIAGHLGELRRQIAALPGVILVDYGYDVLLAVDDEGLVVLYHPSGDRLEGGYYESAPARLLKRLERQVQVQRLLDLRFSHQDFHLRIELPDRSGFLVGERPFEIRVVADEEVWLLLLNVDKKGTVSVLDPASRHLPEASRTSRGTYEKFFEYFRVFVRLKFECHASRAHQFVIPYAHIFKFKMS